MSRQPFFDELRPKIRARVLALPVGEQTAEALFDAYIAEGCVLLAEVSAKLSELGR